jgi:hypothetical protein
MVYSWELPQHGHHLSPYTLHKREATGKNGGQSAVGKARQGTHRHRVSFFVQGISFTRTCRSRCAADGWSHIVHDDWVSNLRRRDQEKCERAKPTNALTGTLTFLEGREISKV